MVVNPNDLMHKLTQKEKHIAENLEKEIDAWLQAQYTGGTATYTLPLPSLHPRIKNNLIQKYEQTGWSVHNTWDQEDRERLEFSQKISYNDPRDLAYDPLDYR